MVLVMAWRRGGDKTLRKQWSWSPCVVEHWLPGPPVMASWHQSAFALLPWEQGSCGQHGPTWVLSAPGGPHVGPMNLSIRVVLFNARGTTGPRWFPNHTVPVRNKTWRTRNAVRSSNGDCEKTTQHFAMMSASDLFIGYMRSSMVN